MVIEKTLLYILSLLFSREGEKETKVGERIKREEKAVGVCNSRISITIGGPFLHVFFIHIRVPSPNFHLFFGFCLFCFVFLSFPST